MKLVGFVTRSVFGVLLLAPGLAVAQQPGGMPQQQPGSMPQQQRTPPSSQASPEGATGSVPAQKVDDKKFVKEAAIGGLMEVKMGELAASKGSTDAIKQYGQKMVDDHTKANAQLKDAAAKAGFEVPDSLDAKHQARLDKFAKLSGSDFDKAYAKDQIKDHEADVRAFQAEAQNGSNAVVKGFAAATLPTVQEHLTMAKDLRKSDGTPTGE